jgi:site-specific recombinase XerC
MYFKRACELAGVTVEVSKGVHKIPSFHILRHSSLTRMAIEMIEKEGKADVVRIAEFAGHKNVSTPLIYIHLGSQYLSRKS